MDTRLLIVDDDRKLQELLSEYLSGFGFDIRALFSGTGLADVVAEDQPALVILDVMLPEKDGLEVLKELRTRSQVPVIMLTARGDDTDRIVGLELGADDYLAKPFNPRELLARIKAVLRRGEQVAEPAESVQPATPRILQQGNLHYDRINRLAKSQDHTVELSSAEGHILEALMEHAGQTLSRDEIMNLTRGRDFMGYERSIDVHVSRIRAKLAGLPGQKQRIRTVWGTGYIFVSALPEGDA